MKGAGMFGTGFRGALIALALMLSLPAGAFAQGPGQGPGGPILVVTGDSFGSYYAEILEAEGLNEFAVAGRSALNAQTLAGYHVVVLGAGAVSAPQASALSAWVQGGREPDRDAARRRAWRRCWGSDRTPETSRTATSTSRTARVREPGSPATRCSSTARPTGGR